MAPGWTTPSTSTPSVVCISRSRSAGSAAAEALLQATTSSLMLRASSSSATSSENVSISSRGRGPYGTLAVSAKYTKSSCGSWTSSSCSTVRPPTPESKTPTGRVRMASCADTPPVWHGDPRTARDHAVASSPSIVSLIFFTTVSAIPPPLSVSPIAITPASRAAISRTRPTYSTVPCPRSLTTAACARPLSSYISSLLRFRGLAGMQASFGATPVTGLRADVPIQCQVCDGTVPWFAPPMRVLVVTNLYPSKERPALGPFVRDQVEAFKRRDDLEIELFAFPPGPRALLGAAARLRSRFKGQRFDIVHAHFGLTAWPALLSRLGPVVVTLHGNDLLVRRSYVVTRAALPFCALTAAVSREFSENLPGAGAKRRVAILPVGIDLHRFRPIGRTEARERLGLDPSGHYLLFPHDPSRPLKRFDRAQAAAGDVQLLTLGGVAPDEVPYWINAATA